jgi:hypothetical protein
MRLPKGPLRNGAALDLAARVAGAGGAFGGAGVATRRSRQSWGGQQNARENEE